MLGNLISSENLAMLAFVGIFHVIGGAALGLTLRSWVDQPTLKGVGNRLFFLIWASGFGCMPLFFGIQEGLGLLGVQAAILLAAITVPLLWRDRILELIADQNVFLIGFGGIFLAAGMAAAGFMLGAGQWLLAILFGGMFSLVGGLLFFGGLRKVFSPEEDGD